MGDGDVPGAPLAAAEGRRPSPSAAGWLVEHPLVVCLPIQAVLLFVNLGHLPIWGDEQASLNRAAMSFAALERALAVNVHPPLYSLMLRAWLALPWSGEPILAARALSGVLLLFATVVIDRCWLRDLDRRSRTGFLLLWTFSPVLVLYGRMARSYSLQLLLASVALHAGRRYAARFSPAALIAFSVAATCLLYAHYLPGIAVLVAVALVTALPLRQRWEPRRLVQALAPIAIVGIAFIAWAPIFAAAIGRVGNATPYRLLGSESLAAAAGVAYTYVAFTAGECLQTWMIPVLLLLTPLIGVCLARGLRARPDWITLVLIAAVVALIGARQWVAYAFVAPRLLFLLPFYLLLLVYGSRGWPRTRAIGLGSLLLLSLGGLQAYFSGEGFLNKAYVIPTAEISGLIRAASGEERAVVILDHHSTSLRAVADRLPPNTRTILVADRGTAAIAEAVATQEGVGLVWFVRSGHDGSAQQWNEQIERAFTPHFRIQRRFFAPYSPLDRWLMTRAGWAAQPTHAIEVLEMRRSG